MRYILALAASLAASTAFAGYPFEGEWSGATGTCEPTAEIRITAERHETLRPEGMEGSCHFLKVARGGDRYFGLHMICDGVDNPDADGHGEPFPLKTGIEMLSPDRFQRIGANMKPQEEWKRCR